MDIPGRFPLILTLFCLVWDVRFLSASIFGDVTLGYPDGSDFNERRVGVAEERGYKGDPGSAGVPGKVGPAGDRGSRHRASYTPEPPGVGGNGPPGLDENGPPAVDGNEPHGVDGSGEALSASTKKGHACEGSTLKIHCVAPDKIHVVNAVYGRISGQICDDKLPDTKRSHWDYSCNASQTLTIVRAKCEGTRLCSVIATRSVFARDGCSSGGNAHLAVEYQCGSDQHHSYFTKSPSVTSFVTMGPMTSQSNGDKSRESGEWVTEPSLWLDGWCTRVERRGIDWPLTKEDSWAENICPNNQDRRARWRCVHGGWLNSPDLSRCVSPQILYLDEKLSHGLPGTMDDMLMTVTEALKIINKEKTADMYGGDLDIISSVLQRAVQHSTLIQSSTPSSSDQQSVADRINQAVVTASSKLLDTRMMSSWLDLPTDLQSQTATRLLTSVEESAFLVANNLYITSRQINRPTPNIVLQINTIVTSEEKLPEGLEFSEPFNLGHDSSDLERAMEYPSYIKLSTDDINRAAKKGVTRVVFVKYRNLDQWLPVGGANESKEEAEAESPRGRIGSIVISAAINERKERRELSKPVEFLLTHTPENNFTEPTCAYWKFSNDHVGGSWEKDGCHVVHSNESHVTCHCSHLTNFAVLMATTSHQMADIHRFTLSLITYFGCMFSIVCLLLAFLTFHFYKSLQCDRNTIHKNLSICLFTAEVVFMLGIVQYEFKILCSIVAVLLHYLFLTAFAWMCLEGVQLYVLLVEVFEAEKSRLNWYYLGAYGVPAIIVGITLAVDYSGYGTESHCWLTVENGFIWAFVAPVTAIVVVNLVMLSIALHTMCKHAASNASWKMKHRTNLETIGSWLKGAFVLVVLLGSTWIFGLFYINQHSLFMAYIFTLFNSLQGVFIFIFHCFMSEKVQKEYRRTIARTKWLPESFRSKFGGTTSTVPNQSSSSGGNYFFKLLRNRSQKSSSSSSFLIKRKGGVEGSSKEKVLILIAGSRDSTSSKSRRCTSSGSDSVRNTDSSGLPPYLEENTEDPSGYLEPALTRCDENEFVIMDNFENSVMENSIFDCMYSPGTRNLYADERQAANLQTGRNQLDQPIRQTNTIHPSPRIEYNEKCHKAVMEDEAFSVDSDEQVLIEDDLGKNGDHRVLVEVEDFDNEAEIINDREVPETMIENIPNETPRRNFNQSLEGIQIVPSDIEKQERQERSALGMDKYVTELEAKGQEGQAEGQQSYRPSRSVPEWSSIDEVVGTGPDSLNTGIILHSAGVPVIGCPVVSKHQSETAENSSNAGVPREMYKCQDNVTPSLLIESPNLLLSDVTHTDYSSTFSNDINSGPSKHRNGVCLNTEKLTPSSTVKFENKVCAANENKSRNNKTDHQDVASVPEKFKDFSNSTDISDVNIPGVHKKNKNVEDSSRSVSRNSWEGSTGRAKSTSNENISAGNGKNDSDAANFQTGNNSRENQLNVNQRRENDLRNVATASLDNSGRVTRENGCGVRNSVPLPHESASEDCIKRSLSVDIRPDVVIQNGSHLATEIDLNSEELGYVADLRTGPVDKPPLAQKCDHEAEIGGKSVGAGARELNKSAELFHGVSQLPIEGEIKKRNKLRSGRGGSGNRSSSGSHTSSDRNSGSNESSSSRGSYISSSSMGSDTCSSTNSGTNSGIKSTNNPKLNGNCSGNSEPDKNTRGSGKQSYSDEISTGVDYNSQKDIVTREKLAHSGNKSSKNDNHNIIGNSFDVNDFTSDVDKRNSTASSNSDCIDLNCDYSYVKDDGNNSLNNSRNVEFSINDSGIDCTNANTPLKNPPESLSPRRSADHQPSRHSSDVGSDLSKPIFCGDLEQIYDREPRSGLGSLIPSQDKNTPQ